MIRKSKSPSTSPLLLDDGEIIPSPIEFGSRVRPLKMDEDPVARAEQALQRLSAQFSVWINDELATLQNGWRQVKECGLDDVEAREMLFRAAHDIRGQGETLGYSLAGRVAASLCRLLDSGLDPAALPMTVIEKHVEAITAIVREVARGGDDRVGCELADGLDALTTSIVGTSVPYLDD